MRFPRSAGVLLHITSLPGPYDTGVLGQEARQFVDALQHARVRIWQVLPLGPPAAGNSPYSCYSAFAGNPLLICPRELVAQGWLAEDSLPVGNPTNSAQANFHRAAAQQREILAASWNYFQQHARGEDRDRLAEFSASHAWWLEDFALFSALRQAHPEGGWRGWEEPLVKRQPDALKAARELHGEAVQRVTFEQFAFWTQWQALKAYANTRGIQLFGDMPLFVAEDSADVWSHQAFFQLDENGAPTHVSGVPPDAFSETGQVWHNPLFRWDALQADNFRWWVQRIGHAFACFDMLRIDHFRGLEAYWEIPADAETAESGRWVKGPGAASIEVVREQLGDVVLVAEDLGLITDEVHELRDAFDLPGMRVLQFGFDTVEDDFHRPASFPAHCVGYTGTHDNDTLWGWYHGLSDASKELLRTSLADASSELHWACIEAVFNSAADTVVVPVQDLLGLPGDARMNLPGCAEGNWSWRMTAVQCDAAAFQRLAHLVQASGRAM